MSAADTTIVLLALLPIAENLHTDYITIVWVILAYLLVNTSLVLTLGRIGDIRGRKRMYNIGFVVFTIGSALSGLAGTGLALVIYRVIQGVGAAMLTANSFAIISESFSENERGKAFGANAIVWGIGALLGIILGGIIISHTSWRLIFLINVPIGIFGTVWAYRTLKEHTETDSRKLAEGMTHLSKEKERRKQSLDIPAALAFTISLFFLQLGVTCGLLYSWTSDITVISFSLVPCFLIFFLIWESRYSKDPIIDLSLFSKNRGFTLSIAVALIQSLALFSINFLLIFYFEGIYGLSVLDAAYLIIPMAVASAIMGPFGGMLSDRIGTRVVASSGLAVQAVVLVLLSRLSLSTPLLYVGIMEAFYGIGAGLFWPANTSAIMSSASHDGYGAVSGIMNTFRNTGMIMSFALSLTAATSVMPVSLVYSLFLGSFTGTLSQHYATGYLAGQSFAFEVSALLLVCATLLSLIRGKIMTQKAD